jgi:hypothetical protein
MWSEILTVMYVEIIVKNSVLLGSDAITLGA